MKRLSEYFEPWVAAAMFSTYGVGYLAWRWPDAEALFGGSMGKVPILLPGLISILLGVYFGFLAHRRSKS